MAIVQFEISNSPLSLCFGENSMVLDKNRMRRLSTQRV